MTGPLSGSWSDVPRAPSPPGVTMRVVWLEGLMLGHAELEPGADVVSHAHPEEQIGSVLSGSIRVTLDGVEHELGAGELYRVPAGVEHWVVAGPEGATLVEAWSPPRAALRGDQ